jgi:hypothetical protein
MEALEALDMGERAELLAGHPTSTKQFRVRIATPWGGT